MTPPWVSKTYQRWCINELDVGKDESAVGKVESAVGKFESAVGKDESAVSLWDESALSI